MKYLFSDWPGQTRVLKMQPRRIFLFDIDGTLSPIAETPGKARVSSKIRGLLRSLREKEGSLIGIISGRSLADARRMVKCPGLLYAGNHGLEMKGRGLAFVHPGARIRSTELSRLAHELRKFSGTFHGILIENKGLTLSVHFRRIQPKEARKLRVNVRKVIKKMDARRLFELSSGKKVIEIRPRVRWHKGSAVNRLRTLVKQRAPVFYIGDDTTDENAFNALRPGDIGVRVGRSKTSHASFYLKSQKEMKILLERLVAL